jgi:hypothetical protein
LCKISKNLINQGVANLIGEKNLFGLFQEKVGMVFEKVRDFGKNR